ncbi:MAG: PAS domain S-box protein [Candidatus Hodarchaeota archaeon]
MLEEEQLSPLANIFDLLPDPAFLFKQNYENKVILEKFNLAGQKVLGECTEEYLGKKPYQLSDFPLIIESHIKKVLETGETIRSEIFSLKTVSRDLIFCVDIIKLSNNYVLMLAKNLSKLKQSEKEVQENHEFNFGLLAEYAPLGIMYLSSEGTIKYTNPKSTRQLGFFKEKIRNVIGKSVLELPYIENNPEIKEGIQKLLNGEPLVGLEIENPNGVPLTIFGTPRFAADGSIEGAVFMYLDSVQLEEMQVALKEKEDQNFGLLAEYSPLGIINLNSEGTITFANPTSTKLFGWQDGQVSLVEGKNILDIPYISKSQKICNKINQLLEGEPLVGLEFQVSFMGKERVLRTYGSPHYDPKGDIKGAILMYADITDLKETQKKLRRQKEELSEFAHQMSHDLTTLIVSILGYSELLYKEHNPIFVEKIVKNAKRMQSFLRASLELADAGKVIEKKSDENLEEIIDEVAELVIPNTITYQREPILEHVVCDREKTSQIFLNLFKNAVNHGKPNKIEVKCKISEGLKKKVMKISITNDGKAITPKIREKLFQKGFTTKKDGRGYGLHIVRKLCEAHSWTIDLDPSTNETTFNLCIPQLSEFI